MIRAALRCEAGAAAAETAIVMVALSALLALLAGAGGALISQSVLEESSRTVAREIMRGVPEPEAMAAGHRVSGGHASFTVERAGDHVTVRATRDVRIGGRIVGHTFTLTASATARIEPHLVGASPLRAAASPGPVGGAGP